MPDVYEAANNLAIELNKMSRVINSNVINSLMLSAAFDELEIKFLVWAIIVTKISDLDLPDQIEELKASLKKILHQRRLQQVRNWIIVGEDSQIFMYENLCLRDLMYTMNYFANIISKIKNEQDNNKTLCIPSFFLYGNRNKYTLLDAVAILKQHLAKYNGKSNFSKYLNALRNGSTSIDTSCDTESELSNTLRN